MKTVEARDIKGLKTLVLVECVIFVVSTIGEIVVKIVGKEAWLNIVVGVLISIMIFGIWIGYLFSYINLCS